MSQVRIIARGRPALNHSHNYIVPNQGWGVPEGGQGKNPMDTVSAANRRKEDRTAVDDNVYVVINTQPEMMGQMVEISSTGMAFTFVDLDAVSQRLNGCGDLRMDFFAAGKGYFIRDLPARLVSAVDTSSSNAISSLMIKRIGVEFVTMSLCQQVQINSLIRRQNGRHAVAVSVPQSA